MLPIFWQLWDINAHPSIKKNYHKRAKQHDRATEQTKNGSFISPGE